MRGDRRCLVFRIEFCGVTEVLIKGRFFLVDGRVRKKSQGGRFGLGFLKIEELVTDRQEDFGIIGFKYRFSFVDSGQLRVGEDFQDSSWGIWLSILNLAFRILSFFIYFVNSRDGDFQERLRCGVFMGCSVLREGLESV